MSRLVLVDTADELPGLLPLHAWSALMSSDLVLVGADDHPFRPHLNLAELRVEVVPTPNEGAALSRTDLLSGLAPSDKRRAEWIVDRAREAGEAVYLFGPSDADAFTHVLGMEAARAGVEVEIVYFGLKPTGSTLLELVGVQQRLRGPDGCPWDAEQTHASLARYAVEEVYELLEAIESGSRDALREELGDLLLQVVFHAQVAADNPSPDARFDIDDVARGIVDKLVRRHPHVYKENAPDAHRQNAPDAHRQNAPDAHRQGVTVDGADAVAANWERLKAAEKPERTGVFDGVPVAQPALEYATALQRRAARAGFDWDTDEEAAERVRLELDEFRVAPDDDARAAELGDLLLSVAGLARRHGLDPELALRGAARRFRKRFEAMAAAASRPLGELSRDEWLRLWEKAKQA